MELEKAKNTLLEIRKELAWVEDVEAIDTVIAELHSMQNLLDEKNDELDRLQKENDLAKKALIANSYEADERNNLLAEVQKLKKENEKLKEIDLTTVHIKGVCDEKERWRNKIREKIEELEKTGCISYDSSTADYVQSQRIGAWQALTDLIYEVVNLKEE